MCKSKVRYADYTAGYKDVTSNYRTCSIWSEKSLLPLYREYQTELALRCNSFSNFATAAAQPPEELPLRGSRLCTMNMIISHWQIFDMWITKDAFVRSQVGRFICYRRLTTQLYFNQNTFMSWDQVIRKPHWPLGDGIWSLEMHTLCDCEAL